MTARSNRYHSKEFVLGVERNGAFKAFPFSELERPDRTVRDEGGGEPAEVRSDWAQRSACAFDERGTPLPVTTLFWFAWYVFHPKTGVFEAD